MNRSAHAPVGIMDSGIGGLTVADAIQENLPGESIVFFGDTAHLPYGDKSADAIRNYTKHIIDFLISTMQCKAVVIACNTASAIASVKLSEQYNNVSVINVIDPVVHYVTREMHLHRIGVIGTKRTIASRAYPNRIKKLLPDATVVSKATPLLAPMIEEGFFNNNISRTIIHEYLSWKQFSDIEGIILGCTHYPHIKKEVEEYFAGKTAVIEGGRVVAEALKNQLANKGMLSDLSPSEKSPHKFLVSDYTTSFEKSTQLFFGRKVQLEARNIWE